MNSNLPEGFRDGPHKSKSRTIDIGFVLALAWLLAAVGMTVLLGPQLGLRGWAWLGVHHILCFVGTSHEFWKAYQRRATV